MGHGDRFRVPSLPSENSDFSSRHMLPQHSFSWSLFLFSSHRITLYSVTMWGCPLQVWLAQASTKGGLRKLRFLEERLPGVRGQEPLSAESIAAFKNSRRDRFGYIEGRLPDVRVFLIRPLFPGALRAGEILCLRRLRAKALPERVSRSWHRSSTTRCPGGRIRNTHTSGRRPSIYPNRPRRRYVKAMYGAPLPVEVGIIFTRKEPLAGWNRSWSAE